MAVVLWRMAMRHFWHVRASDPPPLKKDKRKTPESRVQYEARTAKNRRAFIFKNAYKYKHIHEQKQRAPLGTEVVSTERKGQLVAPVLVCCFCAFAVAVYAALRVLGARVLWFVAWRMVLSFPIFHTASSQHFFLEISACGMCPLQVCMYR